MASGRRKRNADALRLYVLEPAGLTNVPNGYAGDTTRQNNLVNLSIYSSGGYSPTFTPGSTTLLSNNVSNADTCWTIAGLTGETTNASLGGPGHLPVAAFPTGTFFSSSMSSSIGVFANGTKHYYFPKVGTQSIALNGSNVTDLSSSGTPNTGIRSPVIIYSYDGPQASFDPTFLGGTTATASIKFGPFITGSGTPSHLVVYVGGRLALGDQIRLLASSSAVLDARIIKGSEVSSSILLPASATPATASSSDLVNNSFRKAFLIPTASVAGGFIVQYCSATSAASSLSAGVFVAVSSGTYAQNPA